MRPWQRLLGSVIGVLVMATVLAAQTAPLPRLPPESVPAPAPSADPGGAASQTASPEESVGTTRPRPWEYSLGAGVGWDSNVNFDYQIAGEASSVALAPRGSLARVFWGPRGELRTGASGSWIGYPNESLNRYYLNLGLDGQYQSSPKTTWAIGASYDLGHSDSSRVLSDQGLLLPLVETRTLTSQVGLSQELSTHTSLRVGGRFYLVEFIDAPAFTNGKSVRGSVALERGLNSRNSASVEYSIENVLADTEGRSFRTHFGSLQWTRLFSSRSALLIEGGASYTPNAALASLASQTSFFGGFSFSRQVKRSNIALYLRREVVPAFGFGISRAETRGGANAAVPFGGDWQLRLSAYGTQPSTPPDTPLSYYSSVGDVSVSLGRRLRGRLEVSGEVRYRRRGATSTLPSVQAFQGGIFVSLLTPSARALLPGY